MGPIATIASVQDLVTEACRRFYKADDRIDQPECEYKRQMIDAAADAIGRLTIREAHCLYKLIQAYRWSGDNRRKEMDAGSVEDQALVALHDHCWEVVTDTMAEDTEGLELQIEWLWEELRDDDNKAAERLSNALRRVGSELQFKR